MDSAWPSDAEWATLNKTIGGALLRTTPVASSCWPGNPFNSPYSCDAVKGNWSSGIFHAALPESIDYPIFANNSCLPPGASGYDESRGCELGGLPEYIVNATTAEQVATAMTWAAERNIRITVKGTGHDMNGRSSGSYSLSIWTRNFNHIVHHPTWTLPDNTTTIPHSFAIGSGNGWGAVLTKALSLGRVVTTGQDGSVGPGGWVQGGGGHGPLSRTYGLGAHQVLQATIVTTTGEILVADDEHNADIFWAIRGGGGGQYGVVTEYVIKTHPAPQAVVGTLSIVPKSNDEASVNASWAAAATLLSKLPDLMDAGFAGASMLSTGVSATKFVPTIKQRIDGVAVSQVLWAFNMSAAAVNALVAPVVAELQAVGNNATLDVSFSAGNQTDYKTFYSSISGSNAAGSGAVMSTRLLGRRELVDTPLEKVEEYLRTGVLLAQNQTAGTYVTIGLQGGPGVAGVSEERWGAVNPVWRDTYLHVITTGASMDPTGPGGPKQALSEAAAWMEEHKEKMWREWAPETGAYMNEANPYNSEWKHDFYGSTYDKLVEIKKKYDPSESLYVINGVGTEGWEYDLDSGKLCKNA
ncbi:Isoamyl alcohol oxidase [Lasiodiplodia theobromae]|uniref:Isoamyl alcohol oxidase n=1 Tax=Lasiodiplodia theobromae TaxID=45133 RepID=UPI0015C327B3|nr:Isoamyl alcohol oxidase [Lasiodiplodia theobromae]KAF4546559.1 Isoamyl alcohol oxidase [Lasiodiplodia theobromae]